MSLKIGIIGGGACGMMAAITAAAEGACVTIYEGNDRLGKKILATGNGKCNLGNRNLSAEAYRGDRPELIRRCLERFGTEDTIAFFESLGLMIREKNGYLYPFSEQAASVLDVLRLALERLSVTVVYGAKIDRLKKQRDGSYQVGWPGGTAVHDAVIIACGSKAAPKTGSDGSGYKLASQLGIRVVETVPALVQLKCAEDYCKAISGVRTDALIHIWNGGKKVTEERGELQLVDYGISGIPVFQLSGQVNQLLKDRDACGTKQRLPRSSDHPDVKQKQLRAEIDFLPGFSAEEWEAFAEKRLAEFCGSAVTVEEFFTGLLHKKLMILFIKLSGLKTNMLLSEAEPERIWEVFKLCKSFSLHITGSNSYDNAQICAGGVSLKEVTNQLEAVAHKGLFFAGEVLHVDGRCGGYNLQWAWTSGYIAGKAAAGKAAAALAEGNAAGKRAGGKTEGKISGKERP